MIAGDRVQTMTNSNLAQRSTATKNSILYYGYWITLAAFFAQLISVGTQNGVTSTMLDAMSGDFGWERSEFLLGQTGSRVTMALVGFVVGAWIDRWGG